ncbi:MAG TPA: hypothetical protein VFQ61_29170 [Polyangiaceae bacterium]|nr:hypothetical protein [Polyangiaceae bacterium]
MGLSFERFLQITCLLAVGSSAAPGCKVEVTDGEDRESRSGGSSSAQGGSSGQKTNSGGAGEGGGGSGGTLENQGGSGGEDTVNAGAGGADADSKGGTDSGSGGSDSMADAGAGGQGVSSCVSGAPAEEGLGFDCASLPFAEAMCPNPTGEGLEVPVVGMQLCEYYANQRTGSVQVLTECLAKLGSDGSACTLAAAEAAYDCEAKMLAQTCASPRAEALCDQLQVNCAEIPQSQCIRDLSPLSDEKIADIENCLDGDEAVSCEYSYRACRGIPERAVTREAACDSLMAQCAGIERRTCLLRVDVYGTGVLWETTLELYRECTVRSTGTGGGDCGQAFLSCTD